MYLESVQPKVFRNTFNPNGLHFRELMLSSSLYLEREPKWITAAAPLWANRNAPSEPKRDHFVTTRPSRALTGPHRSTFVIREGASKHMHSQEIENTGEGLKIIHSAAGAAGTTPFLQKREAPKTTLGPRPVKFPSVNFPGSLEVSLTPST